MTILFDLTSLADHLSGIERFAANVALTFIKKNTDKKYILFFKNEVDSQFETIRHNKNVIITILSSCNKLVFSQIKLPIYLKKYKADYYLFLAFPAPFLFCSKNSISAIHDMGCFECPQTMKRFSSIYYQILYRKAAFGHKKIVTVSKYSKRRINMILNKSNEDIFVVYDAVNDMFRNILFDINEIDRVRRKYRLPSRYILTLSTIEPRKNIQILVNAFSMMNFKEDISLVIAGRKGWLVDRLLEDIGSKKNKNIIITGFVEDNDLPYIYMMADLFVFPSIYEGFGLPPLEAMACGCPVISSNATSMPEILGDAAMYFENNNVNSLIAEIEKWRNDDISLQETVKQCGKLRAGQYTWEKSAQMLKKVIG